MRDTRDWSSILPAPMFPLVFLEERQVSGWVWVSSYTIPSADDPSVGALKDIQASGVQGTLIYPRERWGSSMIAVFPRVRGG